MSDAIALIAALDGLYEAAVSEPAAWDDAALASWTEDFQAGSAPLDKAWAREVRRSIRNARRLARFWAEADRPRPPDWRSAVDIALGGRGWEPTLAIARLGLDGRPDEELFAEVKRRFQVAHFRPWMEGVGVDEWLASRSSAAGEAER